MIKIERYEIDNEFKVSGIITEENPNGDFIYDPFVSKEVLPFWGTLVTTFWGLNEANRKYLIENIPKDKLKEYQFKKYWIFWFCNGSLEEQCELFFIEDQAKDNAYKFLQIFNNLQEVQVDRLISEIKKDFEKGEKL